MNVQNYWDIADDIVKSTDPYHALANAIIVFAITEYHDAIYNQWDGIKPRATKTEIETIENFFNGVWFKTLTNLDGKLLIQKAKKEIFNEYPEYLEKLKEKCEFRAKEIAAFLADWTTARITNRNFSEDKFAVRKRMFRNEMYHMCFRAIMNCTGDDVIILNPHYVDKIMDSAMRIGGFDARWFRKLWKKQYTVAFDSYTVRLYDMNHMDNPPEILLNVCPAGMTMPRFYVK